MDPMKVMVILMVMLFASPFILQIAAGGILVSIIFLVMVPIAAVLAFRSYKWYYYNKITARMALDYPEKDDIEE